MQLVLILNKTNFTEYGSIFVMPINITWSKPYSVMGSLCCKVDVEYFCYIPSNTIWNVLISNY